MLFALRSWVCNDPAMYTPNPKDKPESKFAEVIRKGKEKREGMNRTSDERARAEQESPIQEDSITES